MNPYKVLGVSENATQEEIRKAYLALVKKYHPDRYADGPMKDMANEKLKEINQAYEMLTKKPNGSGAGTAGQGGYSQQTSYGGGYAGGSYGSAGYGRREGTPYSGPYAEEFNRARAFINQNNLNAARAILDRVDVHNAEWLYLYGIIYLRQGWYEKARECIKRAYEAAPDNSEYRNAYTSLNNAGRSYQTGTYGTPGGVGNTICCSICPALMCLDCCTGGCFC